jgi:hypothetical protein
MRNGRAVFWRAAGQAPARKQPSGLPIFGAAAALLAGRRSMKDILPRRASQHRQISGNAPVPHLIDMGSKDLFHRIQPICFSNESL